MYLVFDCSAQAGTVDFKANFNDVDAWPRLLHLSWILLDENYKPIEDFDAIVDLGETKLDSKTSKKAGIDEEDIAKKQTDLEVILNKFSESVSKAQYACAHNLNYNENILAAEYVRAKKSINLFSLKRFCLMQEGTYYCKLPGARGSYKYPSLIELHATCFSKTYTPPGNARADVIAATRCFIKLKKIGELEDVFDELG